MERAGKPHAQEITHLDLHNQVKSMKDWMRWFVGILLTVATLFIAANDTKHSEQDKTIIELTRATTQTTEQINGLTQLFIASGKSDEKEMLQRWSFIQESAKRQDEKIDAVKEQMREHQRAPAHYPNQ